MSKRRGGKAEVVEATEIEPPQRSTKRQRNRYDQEVEEVDSEESSVTGPLEKQAPLEDEAEAALAKKQRDNLIAKLEDANIE